MQLTIQMHISEKENIFLDLLVPFMDLHQIWNILKKTWLSQLYWHSVASILFKILRIWNSQFKCNYVKNEAFFLKFLLHFWILYQILNILKENIIVIANIFLKLLTVKIFVRKLYKEPRFRKAFGNQHVKASQILAKSPWGRYYHVFHHSQRIWFGKCLP